MLSHYHTILGCKSWWWRHDWYSKCAYYCMMHTVLPKLLLMNAVYRDIPTSFKFHLGPFFSWCWVILNFQSTCFRCLNTPYACQFALSLLHNAVHPFLLLFWKIIITALCNTFCRLYFLSLQHVFAIVHDYELYITATAQASAKKHWRKHSYFWRSMFHSLLSYS